MKQENPIIMFDGICEFCNQAVQFMIRHDKEGKVNFASLQSSIGQQLLSNHQLPTDDFDSFILIHQQKVYKKSSAAIHLCGILGGKWKYLSLFKIVPRPIRDGIYDFIAKNRYKWFGQREQCIIPTPNIRKRFLD